MQLQYAEGAAVNDVDAMAQLTVTISGERLSDREVDELARNLLREINSSLRVNSVELATSEAPHGTRSGAGIQLGTVAVALLPVLLNQSIEFIKSWAKRNSNANITVTISTSEDKREVIKITSHADETTSKSAEGTNSTQDEPVHPEG